MRQRESLMLKGNKNLFIIFLLAFMNKTEANSFDKKHLEIAAGIQANSLLYKRGIITYEGYQLTPILSVKLFHPDLLFAGSSLYYKHALFSDKLFFRSRLNFNSTQDKPLYYTSEDEEDRVRRNSTNEIDFYLEYDGNEKGFLRFQYSQDLSEHKGQYLEMRGNLALGNFVKKAKGYLIQPGLFTAVGYGDKRHNEYFYGDGPNSSLNNIEYGILINSPGVIDIFWPTFKLTRFEILGEKNREASYVQEKDGWCLELLMAFKIY